jgi:hypothetical protein
MFNAVRVALKCWMLDAVCRSSSEGFADLLIAFRGSRELTKAPLFLAALEEQ